LRLPPPGRGGKLNDPEDARTNPLGHGLDRAALAGTVPPFEDDADLQALVHHPLLNLDELDMQAREFPLVLLPLQRAVGLKIIVVFVGHWLAPQRAAGLQRGTSWGTEECVVPATFYFHVRKKPMSPGFPPGYSSTSAFRPKPSG